MGDEYRTEKTREDNSGVNMGWDNGRTCRNEEGDGVGEEGRLQKR